MDLGPVRAWTGSTGSGQFARGCFGWQNGAQVEWGGLDPDTTSPGTYGITAIPDSRMVSASTQSCAQKAHLLCLGVDRVAIVAP